MTRRALVTGGCGFIGSNLVKELVNPLSREDDDDVQYFASQCLEACA